MVPVTPESGISRWQRNDRTQSNELLELVQMWVVVDDVEVTGDILASGLSRLKGSSHSHPMDYRGKENT